MQQFLENFRRERRAQAKRERRIQNAQCSEYLDEATGVMVKVYEPQDCTRKQPKFRPIKVRNQAHAEAGIKMGLKDAYELAVSYGVTQPEATAQDLFQMEMNRPFRRNRQTR